MVEHEGGVTFVNCVGSDISLWKKSPYDDNFKWATCLLYDEPEFHLDKYAENDTTWKFYDHITKRYLLGNGKNHFHFKKYKCPAIKIEIKTPLYPLTDLCTDTLAKRLFINMSEATMDAVVIPKRLKTDLLTYCQHLNKMYEEDEDYDPQNDD